MTHMRYEYQLVHSKLHAKITLLKVSGQYMTVKP
eukprot:CAMPEP_0169401478 /NCGR_PEP_ID=MMETSP1017-20121227/54547_1 /TAXON_ID=342587 /ORGANISM="Karlodinium micrum, Strain CCMP2283" /LENGTH=33 /DNA_ID= /DNA_START= /DNA_END= /DNA_ORIENTATION=